MGLFTGASRNVMNNNKHTEDIKTQISPKRRDFLKAGVAMAAVPLMAGMASTALPSKVEAAKNNTLHKKILVISASPRENSNSDALCDEFMRGAKRTGHHVEKIRLSEKNINYCTGCLACIHDPGACVQDDDMSDIHKKMLAADVLILATPVYFHIMNGRMKVFIDRVCPIYTMMRDKEVYFSVSCAGGSDQVESAVESLRVLTRSCRGIKEKGVMAVTGEWDEGAAKGRPAQCRDCPG